MALRVCTTDATTSSGTWYRAEATDLDNVAVINAGTALSSTPTIVAFTPANAGNQIGVILYLKREASWSGSDTITVKLQQNVATVWTDRTTDIFTADATLMPGKGGYNYLALTSYAVTAAASTWRFSITASDTSRVSLCASGNIQYAVFLDTSTANPSSGDAIAIADNKTFTLSGAWTFTKVGVTSMILCNGATFQATSAAAYSVSSDGLIVHSTTGNFLIGTSASPISVANRISWDVGTLTLFFNGMTSAETGYTTSGFNVKFWGAENNNMFTRIASDANSGQAVITGRNDMSAIWSATDVTYVAGSLAIDTSTYTISSFAGAAITMTGNFSEKKLEGGAIVNYNERENLGIYFKSTNGCLMFTTVTYQNLELVGCLFEKFSCNFFSVASTATSVLWRSCFFDSTTTPISTNSPLGVDIAEIEINNCIRWNPASVATVGGFNIFRSRNVVLTNVINTGALGGYTFYLSVCTTVAMTGCVAALNGYTSPYYAACWLAFTNDVTIDDSFFEGSGSGRALEPASSGVTITDSWLQTATSGLYPIYLQSGSDITIENTEIGTAATPASSQIECPVGQFVKIIFKGCTFGSGTLVGTPSNLVDRSYLAIHEHNEVANTHYYYQKFGTITPSGDGLSDTTVRTSGSGKFALRFQPTSSASNLTWAFSVPTGNIDDKTMTVFAWVKINNAAFYAGTHEKPRLSVNYDDGTTVYTEATGVTTWQLLSRSFTPTTSFGQITVTVSGRTDATGTNSYFYLDDIGLQYPPDASLDLGGLDLFANAMPITPPIAIPISAGVVAQAVWTQLTATEWGTGSMGEQLKDGTGRIKYIDGGEIPLY